MNQNDTITAISTGLSEAGISIVRISGRQAFEIADKVVKLAAGTLIAKAESHRIYYGHVFDQGTLVDEVLVSVFRAPKSYTAENTVEINCHGGVVVTRQVLQAVIWAGARPAEPGEFTKRAFLNGRIDLTKAEAVMDVIRAQSEYALQNSISQLQGAIYDKMQDLRQKILYQAAFIESVLDDPEHYRMEDAGQPLGEVVGSLISEMEELISSFQNGRLLKEGIKTVILGRPNAGKSSLLNVLTGEEKAIVTEVAGTTRDVVEQSVMIHGIMLQIMDTAGIRDTDDQVEKIGVNRAKELAAQADLILYVVDASEPLNESDDEILSILGTQNVIVVLNKNDMEPVISQTVLEDELRKRKMDAYPVVSISAKHRNGIDLLKNKIKELFFEGNLSFNNQVFLTSERQKQAVMQAKESLLHVREGIRIQLSEEFLTADLMNAYEQLGLVIGEALDEDLADEIFKQFCMGK